MYFVRFSAKRAIFDSQVKPLHHAYKSTPKSAQSVPRNGLVVSYSVIPGLSAERKLVSTFSTLGFSGHKHVL
jgi:hypothetical protein